jgi:hypothetical protein
MKKIFFALLIATLCGTARAQLVLSLDNLPQMNDSFANFQLTYPDTGRSGMGSICDNSNARYTNVESINFYPKANYPGADSFPGADRVLRIRVLNNVWYYYYSESAGALQLHGSALNDSYDQGPEDVIAYSTPQDEFRIPLKYGDTYTQMYKATLNGTDTSTYKTTVKADASGTLKIPGYTFTNALRVKTYTTYPYRNPATGVITSTIYRWYVKGLRFPVLTSIGTTFNGTSNGSYGYFTYKLGMPVGLQPQMSVSDPKEMSLYPNPCRPSEKLSIHISGISAVEGTLHIRDLNGKEVWQGQLNLDGNNNMQEINAGLKPGIYLLSLLTPEENLNTKIVVH